MASVQTDEIACANCSAACCRKGMAMQMTKAEVSRHHRRMDLRQIAKPRPYSQQLPAIERVIDANGQTI